MQAALTPLCLLTCVLPVYPVELTALDQAGIHSMLFAPLRQLSDLVCPEMYVQKCMEFRVRQPMRN